MAGAIKKMALPGGGVDVGLVVELSVPIQPTSTRPSEWPNGAPSRHITQPIHDANA